MAERLRNGKAQCCHFNNLIEIKLRKNAKDCSTDRKDSKSLNEVMKILRIIQIMPLELCIHRLHPNIGKAWATQISCRLIVMDYIIHNPPLCQSKTNRQLLRLSQRLSYPNVTRVDLENVQNADIDVEGMKKRIIWKKEEDELLAKSYVTMSDDPIIGNDQKGNDFWRHVASYYNDNRPAGSCRRALNVIRSHWHNTVQKSGHSDEDILRLAYEKYRDENNGVAFNLEHVWRIMKTRPLFTPQSDDLLVGTKKARISESGASNTSSNKDASVDLDINEEEIRPIGQKAAKRKEKNKAKSSMEVMTTRYDSMFESFTQYTDIKKNESEWKQKELAIEEMKAKAALNKSEAKKSKYLLKEYEILSKDTSQMTPEQLIVHEHLCDQIREKLNM
ncbi:uncharacterized protein LOC142510344 [Primulina tabacum]|uniref:uncharacterized protein LOC142510344 n=1 Tax=Primulina tabacum TaxID=48773 RepID=UPI003F59436D